jgi:hypothetical protein
MAAASSRVRRTPRRDRLVRPGGHCASGERWSWLGPSSVNAPVGAVGAPRWPPTGGQLAIRHRRGKRCDPVGGSRWHAEVGVPCEWSGSPMVTRVPRWCRRHGLCCSVGIQGISHTVSASAGTVGAVDLPHRLAGCGQHPGQLGSVGAGAFDTDRSKDSPRTNPVQQRPVALRGGGELSIAQRPSETINGCGVMGVRMRVDPSEDLPLRGHCVRVVMTVLSSRYVATRAGRAWRTRQ